MLYVACRLYNNKCDPGSCDRCFAVFSVKTRVKTLTFSFISRFLQTRRSSRFLSGPSVIHINLIYTCFLVDIDLDYVE